MNVARFVWIGGWIALVVMTELGARRELKSAYAFTFSALTSSIALWCVWPVSFPVIGFLFWLNNRNGASRQ